MIYDRKNETLTEPGEYRKGTVSFLYETIPGRLLLRLVVSRWFSSLCALYYRSPLSRRSIRPFVQKHGVKIGEEELEKFRTFQEFFTRKKEIFAQTEDPNALLAVADSKMRYYPITEDLRLTIKNSVYDLEDILEDRGLAESFRGGTCIVFRLGMEDYHRYHFLDDGFLVSSKWIKGVLHTVRPLSEKYRVFARNSRQVNILETAHFGQVVQVEVGALLVGRIEDRGLKEFSRMEEKGHFDLGGSTVLLLLNKPIAFEEDIAKMNDAGVEIQVYAGERIGYLC